MLILVAMAWASPLRETALLASKRPLIGLGYDVAALGDVDQDGFDDVAAAGGVETGATYLWRGGAIGFEPAEVLAEIESSGPTWVVQGVGDQDVMSGAGPPIPTTTMRSESRRACRAT